MSLSLRPPLYARNLSSSRFNCVRLIKEVYQNCTHHHFTIFTLTFFSYAIFHAARKIFSNIKTTLSEEWSPTNLTLTDRYDYDQWNSRHFYTNKDDATLFLGTLDTIFMLSYAVGLYISGFIGDRFEPRKLLSIGMCLAALSVFMFGTLSEWVHLYNIPYYVGFWILNGLLQSIGWPVCIALMGNWFGRTSRGFVLGVWSSCASVGNIIGALIASQSLHYGYDYVVLLTSSVMFATGIILFFSIVNTPKEAGLCGSEDSVTNKEIEKEPLLFNNDENPSSSSIEKKKAIGFFQAVCLPGVVAYSLSYACLKLVNYSFFFWLPFYLNKFFNWNDADSDAISAWYDVGGIIGGIVGGIISDCLGKRAVVVVPMLILSLGALFGYSKSPNDRVINSVLMTITGIFINGPANMISSAVTADLGQQESIRGNSEALATVTGIIDGTGSIGAAFGQLLIPVITRYLEWTFVFYFFMIMTFLTIVCIFPLFIREIKSMAGQRQQRQLEATRIEEDSVIS